jgi:hypothetical protein
MAWGGAIRSDPDWPELQPGRLHIYPLRDIFTHTISLGCICSPRERIEHGHVLVIHHSFDGRESVESNRVTKELPRYGNRDREGS